MLWASHRVAVLPIRRIPWLALLDLFPVADGGLDERHGDQILEPHALILAECAVESRVLAVVRVASVDQGFLLGDDPLEHGFAGEALQGLHCGGDLLRAAGCP